MIKVGQRERTAVFDEVYSHGPGDIGKGSIAIVGVENVSFVAAPGSIRPDQFIESVPSLLVVLRGLRFGRGVRNHLPPEKTVQVSSRWSRHHAIGNVQVGKTVMIEIPGIARPRPAAHFHSRRTSVILKDPLRFFLSTRIAE